VLITAKIFEKNFLIDDRCHQVFLKTRFLFNGFLSIKIPLVQTFFTNLEIVSLDGNVVPGNFLLHDLYEVLLHIS
jgi:hypothetical protein